MKKFSFKSSYSKGRPFWLPWGIWGTILRYLGFLALLLLILFLLSLLMKAPKPDFFSSNKDKTEKIDKPDRPDKPKDPWPERLPIKNAPIIDRDNDNLWNQDQYGKIERVDNEDIITDPDNPYRQIVDYKLNIILDDHGEEGLFHQFLNELRYLSENIYVQSYDAESRTVQIVVPAELREEIKQRLHELLPDYDFIIFDEALFGTTSSDSRQNYSDPALRDKEKSWWLDAVQAYDAWEITKGDPEVVVAIIDSYIDTTHPELNGHIVKPHNFVNNTTNPCPPTNKYNLNLDEDGVIYHGTHVAATAVGNLNNAQGIAGIAPNATLMPIALGDQMTSMNMARAMLTAINGGADVINLSIAVRFPDDWQEIPIADQVGFIEEYRKEDEQIWDYIFNMADKRNVTIVWSAGNCNVIAGMDETKRGKSTIRVNAMGPDYQPAYFTNFGHPEKGKSGELLYSDLTAPGMEIYNAAPGNTYISIQGTSMAAPIVTGAVALMKSVNPNLTNEEIVNILQTTGKKLNTDAPIGPLIQIRDALEAAGGEYANFDEIMENPKEIIGTWRTTEMRDACDAATGAKLGYKVHIFLEINSTTSGRIRFESEQGNTYTAPIGVKIGNNSVVFDMKDLAYAPGDPVPFTKETYICTRDNDGRLLGKTTSGSDDIYFVRVK